MAKKRAVPRSHYEYELVAGSRARPQGFIGMYATKREAWNARNGRNYACYIKRVKVVPKSA